MKSERVACFSFVWQCMLLALLLLPVDASSQTTTTTTQQPVCHVHEWDGADWCTHCHEPCIGQADYIATTSRIDVFWQWNCIALEANVEDHMGPEPNGETLTLTQGPPLSARVLAMVHISMWDAYNMVNGGKFDTYMSKEEMEGIGRRHRRLRNRKKNNDDDDENYVIITAAVSTAAYTVMADLYKHVPSILALISNAYQATLALLPNNDQDKQDGIEIGRDVGNAFMLNRLNDGYAESNPYLMFVKYFSSMNAGNHNVDPLNEMQGFFNPGMGQTMPFMEGSMNDFLAPIPPGLIQTGTKADGSPMFAFNPSDPLYLAALDQVKRLGDLNGRNTGDIPDTTVDPGFWIGNYWSYNGSPCTGTPPRAYNIMARYFVRDYYPQQTLQDNALLFTMLNVGLGNAGIAAWDAKYTYDLWRPIRGIREHPSTTDGRLDADWEPLGASRSNKHANEMNFSPPFPAYTSGHATFGAVAFKVLQNFYQQDRFSGTFVFTSDEWNGMTKDFLGRKRPLAPRWFQTFTTLMAENAASRVFNGVHWGFDGVEGVRVGVNLADYIYETMFLPAKGKKGKKRGGNGGRGNNRRGLRMGMKKKSSKSTKSTKSSKKKGKSSNQRTASETGDFEGAIACILANPNYQVTGACNQF